MFEQESLFCTSMPDNCYFCKHFSELREPRERSDGFKIFGYCFKDKYNMEKGYPVFIPEGKCESFSRSRKTGGLT